MGYFGKNAGVVTDVQDPSPRTPVFLKGCGFEWMSFQAQNGGDIKDYDLRPALSFGLNAGVWGVCYGDFAGDGKRLVDQAVKLGAQHLIMNAERTITPIQANLLINACKDFHKPKAILGLIGDSFNMSLPIFVAAEWDVITESYLCDQPNLTPSAGKDYALRAGVPFTSYNAMLGMYFGANGQIPGATYSRFLFDAGFGRNFSCYMAQHGTDQDYVALKPNATYVAPIENRPTTYQTWATIKPAQDAMIAEWRRQGMSEVDIQNTRIFMDRQLADKSQQWWSTNILPLLGGLK